MKPIVRWTIGNAPPDGITCLRYSIKKFFELYGDRFSYYLLYNSVKHPRIYFDYLNLINQNLTEYYHSLPGKPTGVAWKLYPPRIDIRVPEIFIDSDLVIYKKLEEIEQLLDNNTPFITEDSNRLFGNYDHFIDGRIQTNTGLFGIGSQFDFRDSLLSNMVHNDWRDGFDEQGLVSKIMYNLKSAIIPLSKVNVFGPKIGALGTHGTHFVILNRKTHPNWIAFSKKTPNFHSEKISII